MRKGYEDLLFAPLLQTIEDNEMKKFEEQEAWLIKNWVRARELEKSMDQVREGYRLILERAVEHVKTKFKQFDRTRIIFENSDEGTQLGFGRACWPINKWGSPSGIWIYNLELDNLLANDSKPIWMADTYRLEVVRSLIKKAAPKVLRRRKSQYFDTDEDLRTIIRCEASHAGQQIHKMLLDRDSGPFVEWIADNVACLVGFETQLDSVFKKRR